MSLITGSLRVTNIPVSTGNIGEILSNSVSFDLNVVANTEVSNPLGAITLTPGVWILQQNCVLGYTAPNYFTCGIRTLSGSISDEIQVTNPYTSNYYDAGTATSSMIYSTTTNIVVYGYAKPKVPLGTNRYTITCYIKAVRIA